MAGRAELLREEIERDDLSAQWVLEEQRHVVGSAGAHLTWPSMTSIGVGVLGECAALTVSLGMPDMGMLAFDG